MEEIIKDIVSEKLNIDRNKISVDTNFVDFVQDSISRIEMLFELESALKVRIPQEYIADIETVGDLIGVLDKVSK